jgi:hypothetical protein
VRATRTRHKYSQVNGVHMNRKPSEWGVSELVSAGVILLTVGGLAIGVRSAPDSRLPPYIEILGNSGLIVVTLGLSVFLFLTAMCMACIERLRDAALSVRFKRPSHEYYMVTAGTKDLEELYEHYTNLFGHDIVPMDQMASWMKKNSQIAWKVMRVRTSKSGVKGDPELIGFFDIEPLTLQGESKVRSPNARASGIKKGDIHSGLSRRAPSAYYVGSVGCPANTPLMLRGICMVFFISKMLELAGRNTVTVYARPATDEGVYLVRHLFSMNRRYEGPDKEVIWYIDINSERFNMPAPYQRIAKRIGVRL